MVLATKSLKFFPQFSVSFGSQHNPREDTSSTIFVMDSLLYVMDLYLPVKAQDPALIAFDSQRNGPTSYSNIRIIALKVRSLGWSQIAYQLAHEMCYQRSKNRYISLRLLPIFERFPKTWHAIPYLSKVPAQLSFPDSLAKWIELSPMESRNGLQELALVFGVTVPLV